MTQSPDQLPIQPNANGEQLPLSQPAKPAKRSSVPSVIEYLEIGKQKRAEEKKIQRAEALDKAKNDPLIKARNKQIAADFIKQQDQLKTVKNEGLFKTIKVEDELSFNETQEKAVEKAAAEIVLVQSEAALRKKQEKRKEDRKARDIKKKNEEANYAAKQKQFERLVDISKRCAKCKQRECVNGRSRCQECLNLEKGEEEERKLKGLCKCGKKLKEGDKYYCGACKQNRKKKAKRLKKKIATYCGLCTNCNKIPAMVPGGLCLYCRFNHAEQEAGERGLLWELTLEEYENELSKPCYYCELRIILTRTGVGLDRLDNRLGYTTNNSVGCCWICNLTRNDFYSPEDFKQFIAPGIRAFRQELESRGVVEYKMRGGGRDAISFLEKPTEKYVDKNIEIANQKMKEQKEIEAKEAAGSLLQKKAKTVKPGIKECPNCNLPLNQAICQNCKENQGILKNIRGY